MPDGYAATPMTRWERGLVIGKFRVPHAGHHHLIGTAAAECCNLTVLLMARSSDPLPAALRLQWLRTAHPGADIRLAEHELPVDYEDSDVWDMWIRLIHDLVPKPADAIFSSEPYGEELARRLRAAHIVVDRDRIAFPVSATAALVDPDAHARFLGPEVLAYLRSLTR